MVSSNEDKIITENDNKEKSLSAKKNLEEPSIQKLGTIPLLSAYWKHSEKPVQWLEDMAQDGFGLFLRKKTWIG